MKLIPKNANFITSRHLYFTSVIFFVFAVNSNANDHVASADDIQSNAAINFFRKSPSISNLSTIVGETVYFNCSLASEYNSNFLSASELNVDEFRLSPTWLKADPVYSQTGWITGYKTENIIVTRKGIIADNFREKMKLIKTNDQFQTLRISNVNVRNEGKFICREFNSQFDKLFYLNVHGKFYFRTFSFW